MTSSVTDELLVFTFHDPLLARYGNSGEADQTDKNKERPPFLAVILDLMEMRGLELLTA